MLPITIRITEDRFKKLQEMAQQAKTSPEELLEASVEEWLGASRQNFVKAAEHVLRKNAELYRRLS